MTLAKALTISGCFSAKSLRTIQASKVGAPNLASSPEVPNEVMVEVKRQFLAVETGIGRVAAFRKAVDASIVAAEGTRRGMRAGIRTNTDVLDAERQMFFAKRDLAQARYEFLASTLLLKTAAGVLSEKDVAEIEALLVPQHDGGQAAPVLAKGSGRAP